MPKKKLIGNQESLPDDQRKYRFNKDGSKKAILVHILGRGDCPRCFEKVENNYTDGNEVWRRITN